MQSFATPAAALAAPTTVAWGVTLSMITLSALDERYRTSCCLVNHSVEVVLVQFTWAHDGVVVASASPRAGSRKLPNHERPSRIVGIRFPLTAIPYQELLSVGR